MPRELLNDQIARATGEDRRTIARLGFGRLKRMPIERQTDETRKPLVVDWDELERDRSVSLCR